MKTERYTRTQQVRVEECERCEGSHEFPIEVIFDRVVDAFGLMRTKTECRDVVVKCPVQKADIVISVPVTLTSLETLVHVRPKG